MSPRNGSPLLTLLCAQPSKSRQIFKNRSIHLVRKEEGNTQKQKTKKIKKKKNSFEEKQK